MFNDEVITTDEEIATSRVEPAEIVTQGEPVVTRVEPARVMASNDGVGQVRRSTATRYAPDAAVAATVGLVVLVVGLIAVIRGGFEGSMNVPIVQVLGFSHTTTLGLIEVGLGICLLTAGAMQSRNGAMFFGLVMGVGGFIGAVQNKSFRTRLALETSMAWLVVVAAIAVVMSALLMPRMAKTSTSIYRK